MVNHKRIARLSLKKLLYKLGIASANKVTVVEALEQIDLLLNSYGKPDQLIMHPASLEDFIREFEKK